MENIYVYNGSHIHKKTVLTKGPGNSDHQLKDIFLF